MRTLLILCLAFLAPLTASAANSPVKRGVTIKEQTYESKLSREHDNSFGANVGVQFPTLAKVDFAPAIGVTYLRRIYGQWRGGISVSHSKHQRRITESKDMITPVLAEGNYLFNEWLYAAGLLGATMHSTGEDEPTNVLPTFGARAGFVFYKQENWALSVENSITVAVSGDESFLTFQIPISMSYRF